jgi:hypothetical protein
MTTPSPDDYHEARAGFRLALDEFEARVGRRFERQTQLVDAKLDLSIDVAELRPEQPRRLYVAVSGIHGIEGYAGSAILRGSLASVLPGLDLESSGILLVHALNPTGMYHRSRVNEHNVDLNRNFAVGDASLYESDSDDYELIASILQPVGPCVDSAADRVRFLAAVGRAILRHGFAPLRQATLAGQYAMPNGLFYGGSAAQVETRFFQRCFEMASRGYPEVLLTDLHTGYGRREQVSSLFARADSLEFQALAGEGAPDVRGRDQAYAARGDLVAFCQRTAKRHTPDVIFNGVVVELGTTGLGMASQLGDLYTLIRENQLRHYGSATPGAALRIARAFGELFNPSDPGWRKQVIVASLAHIQRLLGSRRFL